MNPDNEAQPADPFFSSLLYNYQGPESFEEKAAFTEKSDVFSLGMIFFSLLTHCLPWSPITSPGIMRKIVLEDARPPVPSIPEKEAPKGYVSLMKRCWSTNPENRPDIADVINELSKMRMF